MEALKTVHDAMQAAQQAAQPIETKPYSFRAPSQAISTAHQICDRHGVTLGSFLRECVNSLVADYGVED